MRALVSPISALVRACRGVDCRTGRRDGRQLHLAVGAGVCTRAEQTLPTAFEAGPKTAAGSIDYARDGSQIVAANRDIWASTLKDAVTHAASFEGTDPRRAGLLGFSLGGHLCLRIRSTAKVLVKLFAPMLDGIGASGNPGLQVQIHHGTGDRLVPVALNAAPIAGTLRAGGAIVDLHEYRDAGHGFMGTDLANSTALTQSKAHAIAFFNSNL